MKNTLKSIMISLVVSGCGTPAPQNSIASSAVVQSDSIPVPPLPEPPGPVVQVEWKNVAMMDPTIIIDMRYADTANFTHTQIYSCAVCELRPAVADALVKANAIAKEHGLYIKVFDCYRPSSAQQKMYDVVPDKRYVAHPSKGSKHGSGCAVDVTLCDLHGKELDMGTSFDDFSLASHLDHVHNNTVNTNRESLLDIMNKAGFTEYVNEWWHFNYKGCDYPQDDHSWKCN
jgi:D-alanyl-D-alanine dipeptidase